MYTHTAGAITGWFDQAGSSRNFTDSGFSARRPALTIAGPTNLVCADFDGSSDYLTGLALSEYVTASVKYVVMSVMFDAISDVYGPDARYGHTLFCNTGGRTGLFASDQSGDKIHAYNYDGADDEIGQAINEVPPQVVTLRHEGGTLYVGSNNGVEASVASGNTDNLTGPVRIGFHVDYFNGKLFEVAFFNVMPGPAERQLITNYFMRHVGIL